VSRFGENMGIDFVFYSYLSSLFEAFDWDSFELKTVTDSVYFTGIQGFSFFLLFSFLSEQVKAHNIQQGLMAPEHSGAKVSIPCKPAG